MIQASLITMLLRYRSKFFTNERFFNFPFHKTYVVLDKKPSTVPNLESTRLILYGNDKKIIKK